MPRWVVGLSVLRKNLAISSDPELIKAKYKAFSVQLPLMYLMLFINTVAISWSSYGLAPVWLSIGVPFVLSCTMGYRAYGWIKARNINPTFEDARNELTKTNRLAPVIAFLFALWSVAMFQYGDLFAKAHIAFDMAVSVLIVMFCLTHLRAAAIKVAITSNATFTIYFICSGHRVFALIALNAALVSAVMVMVVIFHYRDFARMVETQKENFKLANLDSLTEIPNRRAFFSHLEERYRKALRENRTLAVGIVDLNKFKPINDTYGHPVGDRILQQIAQVLVSHSSNSIQVCRLGGDEFSVVVYNYVAQDELIGLGMEILASLTQPVRVGDAVLQVGASIGFALLDEHTKSAADLFENADYALYFNKRHASDAVTIFSQKHAGTVQREASIERSLRAADLGSELFVMFQPIIDALGNSVRGFEALARWNSNALGVVPPSEFIPVAERAGLMNGLTRVLLEKALDTASTWPSGIRLSFNLSAQDLSSPAQVDAIKKMIQHSKFDAKFIDFEVTETAICTDVRQVSAAAADLRRFGCGVSLDDFGTGFSSLSHLHAMPLTKIKIDRSFVKNISTNDASLKIVKSLLALSRDMGLECIVEGAETVDEVDTLKNLGGALMQGYFFSRPLHANKVAEYLNSHESSDTPHH